MVMVAGLSKDVQVRTGDGDMPPCSNFCSPGSPLYVLI